MTRRVGRSALFVLAVVIAAAGGARLLEAQGARSDALRRQIEQRFEVLPLQNGVALRPRSSSTIQSIELSGDTIAVDGAPVTGAELRQRLGADEADLVLRLSYLTPQDRRALFAPAPPAPPAAPPAPATQPEAAPAPPSPPPPPEPERLHRSAARMRFGGSVTVDRDEAVKGDVVVIGGSARIRGEVEGDVVAVGGSVDLDAASHVTGDVVAIGGTIQRDPQARVDGKINEIAAGSLNLDGVRFGRFPWFVRGWRWSPLGGVFALMSTGSRLVVLALLACLVVLVARDPVERIGARAAAEPIKAGAVGFLAQLLFLPLLLITIVVLVVTIIGIPLLILVPFAVLGLAIIALVGFTGVAYHVGRIASQRFGWDAANPYVDAVVGTVAVLSPLLVARLIGLGGGFLFPLTAALVMVGLATEYLAWTIGFGAVALTRFDRPPAVVQPAPTPPVQ
jgi:hypothetical protein